MLGAPIRRYFISVFPSKTQPAVSTATISVAHVQRLSTASATSSIPQTVVFSGIQPTGVPHLGNYLGALQQWKQLQDRATLETKLLFSIVDLHALTIKQNKAQLQKWRTEALITLLAIGLDPKRCSIFFQSDVPAHAELMWILSCTASMGYLSRMTHWKSKLALGQNALPLDSWLKGKLKLGLFSYPVLQAADILVHRATHVPVGEDQLQHIEFARECARNFNSLHGKVLIEPQYILSSAKRVMSLKEPHLKMSKSHEDSRSRISLTDTPETIHSKVRQALTDSIPGISFDPEKRPGVSSLLVLLSYLDKEGRTPQALAHEYSDVSLRAFKEHVAEEIINTLRSFQERYTSLNNGEMGINLKEIASQGADKASRNARRTMIEVRDSLGL